MKSKLDNDTEGRAIALKWTAENFAKTALSVDRYSIRGCLTMINDLIDIRESSSFNSKNDIFTLILNNFNVSQILLRVEIDRVFSLHAGNNVLSYSFVAISIK